MIKKTILKTFTFGIISSFILLGNYYVNASNYQLFPVSLNKSQSYWNSNYEIGFLPKGRFLSMYIGTSKSIIALDSQYLIWRGSNGGLYMYYNSPSTRLGLIQGFFQYIKVCDEINIHTTGSNIIENCGASQQAGISNDIITNFINKVKLGDYVYIEDNLQFNLGCGSYCTFDSYNIEICFSSNEIGKSMCFLGAKSSGPYGTTNPLTQSQSMSGVNFANIPQSYLSDPPGFIAGGSGEGNGITINTGTNQNYVCPTVGQLMNNMGKNYSTGLCYNNTTYFNGSTFEQVDKQDIFTIFNDNYENYTNRISIYRNNCNSPANNTSCTNAFSGEFKKYSIISNAINSNVDEKNLRNYCNLGLNYDPNATTCVATQTGVIKENYTAEEQLQLIIEYGSITTPGNNTTNTGNNINNNNVINVLNGENREEFINNRNFLDSLGNIYGKITGLFRERNNVNGIIPEYILRITYITLLFTVIFKK